MKRAWPYALALAVVVTGCYLALAPLLRSLSPAPTTSATSRQLTQGSDTVTVGKQTVKTQVKFNSKVKTGSQFVGALKTTKKKKVKKPATTTTTGGFAANPPSSSSSSSSSGSSSGSSSSSSTPKQTPKTNSTPAKTASKGARSVGGGSVDQATDGGFAGGDSSGSMTLGQKPEAGN